MDLLSRLVVAGVLLLPTGVFGWVALDLRRWLARHPGHQATGEVRHGADWFTIATATNAAAAGLAVMAVHPAVWMTVAVLAVVSVLCISRVRPVVGEVVHAADQHADQQPVAQPRRAPQEA